MEVSIGVQFATRELRVDTAEAPDAVRKAVDEAFEKGLKVLWLKDKKGREVAVPVDKLAYVEMDAGANEKRVGFAAGGGDES